MQKKLLTMAVAGALAAPALALAQASGTEVYGTVNMAFGNFKYGQSTAGASSVSKWDVASGASNYGVRSRESLGGGLSAWVQIENSVALERSNDIATSTIASRNSAVGIQGGFGNVFLGQWTTPWADLDGLWSVGTVFVWGPVTSLIDRRESTGTAPNYNCANHSTAGAADPTDGSPICAAVEAGGGVGHSFWKRVSNAIFYQSNVMAGTQVKLAYQTNEGKPSGSVGAASNANASLWSASVQWAGMGGRARVGAAIDRHKDFTTIGASDGGLAVKGGFNFGVVDVGLAWERMTYKCGGQQPAGSATSGAQQSGCGAATGDVKASQIGAALAVPVGPGTIRASYARAKDLDGGGFAGADTGAKEWNVGYEHRFSKRTNVGVGYAKIDNKAASAFTWSGAPPALTGASNTPAAGVDVTTFFVSMTHRF